MLYYYTDSATIVAYNFVNHMEKIILSSGVEIPSLGFGTFRIEDRETCINSVLCALKTGYRLIDTAQAYHNEEYVGEAIKLSGIPREEIFITTKINFRKSDNAEAELEESFRKLGVDYIDLVLIHWPYGNYYHAWRVMEKYYKEGKIKALGISNFDPARMIDLYSWNEVKPVVNQVEAHFYCQRHEDKAWFDKYGVATEAYAPLAQNKIPELFNEPVAVSIANKYNKTVAQVAIRFLLQLGMIVIPKSTHEKRIKENFDVFDFTLTDEEMEALKGLDQNKPIGGKSENPERIEILLNKKL